MTYNSSSRRPRKQASIPTWRRASTRRSPINASGICTGLSYCADDRLVLERYFEGNDHARGIGPIGHGVKQDTLHDLRSCSKSIIGLLYGIALQQGVVPPPEAPLFSVFPEHVDLAQKDGRDRLTIHHVLTMTMGTDWDESSLVLLRSAQQRDRDGQRAGSLSLHPRAQVSSVRPAGTGPTAAARPRCWRVSSRRARARRCINMRAKTCSIRLAWGRPNGQQPGRRTVRGLRRAHVGARSRPPRTG